MSIIKIQKSHSVNVIPPLMMTVYITCVLVSLVLTNKIVEWHGFAFSMCLVTFPMIFLIGDIVAEIYGYKIASQLIFYTILSCVLFSIITLISIHVPSARFYNNSNAYLSVLGQDLKFTAIAIVAIFGGLYVNAYLISKWKFLVNGRFFLLRSLGASIIGEFVNSLIAVPIGFLGDMNYHLLIQLTIVCYVIKIVYAFIFVFPATIIVSVMKSRLDLKDENSIINSELWKKS